MKDGLRVFDSDTHVEPTAEVLDKYVDPGFRPRLADLAPYRVPVRPGNPGGAPGRHVYRYGQISYRRILGEAAPRETHSGRDTHWMGSKMPRVGVQDDQAESRVQDMDDEGTDGHFLIPTAWTSLVGHEDPSLEVGIIRAFHRHMSDFSSQHPDRLKSMIVASARDVDAAVHEIREWGKSRWAVAVMPLVTKDIPADHPKPRSDLARRRRARPADNASQFHLDAALFSGVFDLWDNIFLGRLASHPWGAMRFIASVIGGGIMDRYPNLRVGTLECGFGWLPFWGRRMDEQYAYVGSTANSR